MTVLAFSDCTLQNIFFFYILLFILLLWLPECYHKTYGSNILVFNLKTVISTTDLMLQFFSIA